MSEPWWICQQHKCHYTHCGCDGAAPDSGHARIAGLENTLADFNDALRIALGDDIEGMERERIEDLARMRIVEK
jgi:hypothetical protein